MAPETALIQSAKAVVLALSFGGFMAAQFLWPYHRHFADVAKNWLSNLPLGATNGLLTGLLTSSLMLPMVDNVRDLGFGPHWLKEAPFGISIPVSVVALDLTAYVWHRANHSWAFLWRFHAVHHSDPVFDVSTALRFHPGEVLISTVVRLMVILLLGLPWEGVVGFEMIFTACNLFEHANLRLPARLERMIGMVFVTPALHRLHHSVMQMEQNRNFATIFSVWDRLGRSLTWSWSKDITIVGLSPEDQEKRSFWGLLLMPFKEVKTT